MICFVLNAGHEYTLRDVARIAAAPEITILTYDELIRARTLKAASYIFTDFDRLAYSDLELAGRLYQHLKSAGVRVFNDPARVKLRYGLLRALHREGLNDFDVHKGHDVPSEMRFPVFIRKIRSHGRPCTGLLQTRAEVAAAITAQADVGVPAEHLVIIEYVGEEVRPGVYRKLAEFRVGNIVTPFIGGHDTQWLVKAGRTGSASQELYEDELRIVRDNPHEAILRHAFEIADIEYGRADYGFYRGRLQIFEINTNPHLPSPGGHPSPLRNDSLEHARRNIFLALHTLDSPRGRDITLPRDRELDPHRGWKSYFRRTRLVP